MYYHPSANGHKPCADTKPNLTKDMSDSNTFHFRRENVLRRMEEMGISKVEAAQIHYGRAALTESETSYIRAVLTGAPGKTSMPVVESIERHLQQLEAAAGVEG